MSTNFTLPELGENITAGEQPAKEAAANGGGGQSGESGAKPKAQPAGAPEEGGLSQKAPGQAADSGEPATAANEGGSKGAKERNEGLAEGPEAQQATPESGAKPKRGEVVD